MKQIAIIPGDGIGPEVTREVVELLGQLRAEGLPLAWKIFGYSADSYLREGRALPEGGMEELALFDAIFLGALGDPRVPDMAHGREIILGARRSLDLYVNLRPIRLLHDRLTPLKSRRCEEVDFTIVRENTEGAYIGAGGRFRVGTPEEVAVQEALATRRGVERVLRYAFGLAGASGEKLVMADKHNALEFVGGLWYRTFRELEGEYPQVEARHLFVDALCHDLVRDPSRFGVIVTSNLFGDLISDLGAALAGGLGLAPSANLNPETRRGLFEPVHGSAQDIAGKGIANPMAAFLSAGMMLEFLGFEEAGRRLRAAVTTCLEGGTTTPDLGGSSTTAEVGRVIRNAVALGAAVAEER